MSLAKIFLEVLNRKSVLAAIDEIGFIGFQTVKGFKAVEQKLFESEAYRKRIWETAVDVFEVGLTAEIPADESSSDDTITHYVGRISGKLRAIAGGFYLMGIMVGYYAARTELHDEVTKKDPEVPA